MSMLRASLVFLTSFLLLAGASVSRAQGKSEPNFPTDDEVRLVLTQADRAIQQYKPLIDEEERLFGEKGKEAVARDREVVSTLEFEIKAFRKEPQGFNGPLGFAFFEAIDDADRNVLLSAATAAGEALLRMIDGKASDAASLATLSRTCTDMSNLLYTVSENAGALYMRFAESEKELAAKGAEVAEKCGDILKQKGIIPKQKP